MREHHAPSGVAVGNCPLCGGNLLVPTVWSGVKAPPPQCGNCGGIRGEDNVVRRKKFVEEDLRTMLARMTSGEKR